MKLTPPYVMQKDQLQFWKARECKGRAEV